MESADIKEAAPIIVRTMEALLKTTRQKPGRAGSELRHAVGDLVANVLELLRDDKAGEPMAECFETAREAGATLPSLESVRRVTVAEAPITLGALLTKHCLIQFCLVEQSRVIADMAFKSRQDANAVRDHVNIAFADAEGVAADAMDAMTYRALIELHAAVMFHLVETARPLPRLVRFQFAAPLPTLVIGYRLYDDASRADEVRAENKVVHPAFTRPYGLALSA
jgi:prophage DNA circulation protein